MFLNYVLKYYYSLFHYILFENLLLNQLYV
jgi:hypothetical protein